MNQPNPTNWQSADLLIDHQQGLVMRHDKVIELPDLSFRLLQALIQSAPDVITTEQLMQEVWGSVTVNQETVTQRVALLRKSLGSEPKNQYIASVRNRGYRWVPVVKPHAEIRKHSPKRRWAIIAIGMLILILGLVGFWPSDKTEPDQAVPALSAEQFNRQAWRYLDKHDARSTEMAVGLFRKSLAIRPEHPNTLSGLSIALSHQVTKFNQPASLLAEAKKLAKLATTQQPDDALAWAASAFADDANGLIDQAIIGYEKSLALEPDDASIISSLAYLYAVKGRLFDGMHLNIKVLGTPQQYLDLQIASVLAQFGFDTVADLWYQKADELSPDNVFATHQRGRFLLSRYRFDEASQVVRAAIDRDIDRPELHLVEGIMHWIKQDRTKATEAFQQAVGIDANDVEAQIWLFMARHNAETVPAEVLDAFIEQWLTFESHWPDQAMNRALFYAHFGRSEDAIQQLELAHQQGFRNHWWLLHLPPSQSIRQHPDWAALITVMQQDLSTQRQQLLAASWLPPGFLDPQNY